MFKKTVIGVCGLVFVAALSLPAFADQSIGFQKYFNEGVKAYNEHDDQKALRCFKIAQIYDNTDDNLKNYLTILEQRGVVLEVHFSKPPERSIGYKYYLSGGIKAFQIYDDKKAIRYFKIAKIFYPSSKEADRYLEILAQRQGLNLPIENQPPPIPEAQLQAQEQPILPTQQPQPATVVPPVASTLPSQNIVQPQPYTPPVQPQPATVVPSVASTLASQNIVQPQSSLPLVQPPSVALVPPAEAVGPQPAVYVTTRKVREPVEVVSIAQIKQSGHAKPTLQIELHSAVILEGKNIQRILVVDEGFIGVKTIGTDNLEIDALRIGTTFLHIWDDYGRHTFYVEVVFPKTESYSELQAMNGVQHSEPFTVTYSNDWSTYYSGKNIPDLKRQSYDFNQTLAINGETPYGYFDTSGSYADYDGYAQFDTYTIGLSQIPLEGTSNFNLRGFDALRYLSPLTMPGARLRGAFADVDLMDNLLGLSVSYGQEQEPIGFLSPSVSQFNQSYIDAVQLTLFPTSNTDRYSLNYAQGYGSDRQTYLTDHVYSVEGQHKFNDFLTLNGEEGNDSSHDSQLASLKWQDGDFRSGLNFRNIDKDYTTITTLPANQGETGASWTADTDYKNITASSFIEAYQNHLDSNLDDPRALNYDANGHVRTDITKSFWSDSDFNYVDTPGELSPMRSLELNQRLSRNFSVWNSLKGTIFGGVGYQQSHSSDSGISDYNREDEITGIQLPITSHVATYANYEYDWLNQPDNGGNSNPRIINAGLEYSKQFTPKFSLTSQVDYRNELGVNASNNSFLSGEESVIISSSLNYNPTQDVSIYGDANASRVLSHINNPTYDDFEIDVGMRITFGGKTYWDPLGIVSGVVFKDTNGDGKYVKGDEGIAGVKLNVGDKVAITDKYGRYSVQVRAKSVDVAPILDTIPGGLIFSTPPTLNVQVLQGRHAHAEFGLISQTGIYGIIFVDNNGSGVPNENDKFIGKVRVILDGKIIEKSDTHGAFYFRKVTPGQHIISIDINTLALNMVPLIKLKNKINVAEGTNYLFNIPVKIERTASEEK